MAVVHFLVVAHLFEDVHHEVIGDAQGGAHFTLDAQEAPDGRVVAKEHLIHVLGADAHFLSLLHTPDYPAHHVVPLIVAVGGQRPQGLLRHGDVQDDMVFGNGHGRTERGQLRLVGCLPIAAALFVGRTCVLGALEKQGGELDAPHSELVGQVHLRGGAGGNADCGSLHFLQRLVSTIRQDQHALAVVEVHRRPVQLVGRIPGQGPGRVADQDVNLTGLKGRQPLGRDQRAVLHRVGVAKDRSGEGLAEVNVEALELTLRVDEAETRQLLVDTADEVSPVLDELETLPSNRSHLGALRTLGRFGALGTLGLHTGSEYHAQGQQDT